MYWIREPYPFPESLSKALRSGTSQSAIEKLWPILSKQRGLPKHGEKHYAMQADLAEAYSAYYMPANALKFYFVLEEMRLLGLPLPEKNITVTDLGSGPGSALCSLAWWGKQNKTNVNYVAWEQSKHFITQGERLSASLRSEFPISTAWSLAKQPPLDFLKRQNPDIVLFQNSVHEIFPDPAIRKAELEKILSLLKRLAGPRYLILIEPALRHSSRDLLELRKELIHGGKTRVWLPCIDNRPCGALTQPTDWCHEEVPIEFPDWVNKLGASAQLTKESMLFSYLVLSSNNLSVPGWQNSTYRMVSQRLERKGQTECFLCTQQGKVKARVQRSKVTPESEQLQSWVRGDLFSNMELNDLGDLIQASRLSGTGACQ